MTEGTKEGILRNTYMKQQDAQILVIRLYFPLDALHVSDYISPSSGATFIRRTSHLVYANIYRHIPNTMYSL